MKRERLDKLLSNMGAGSRSQVKELIKSGLVSVNGTRAASSETKVDPENDLIICRGQEIRYRKFVYLMLNKPQGMVSSTDDPRDSVVVELLDDFWRSFKPFPVGRLDKDTEGLLLLTNDGQLAHQLLSPKKGVDKKYFADIDGVVLQEHINSFQQGVQLDDGYKTLPAKLEVLESGAVSRVNVVIQEGKYHQVKRMFAAHGLKVMYLKRIQMGELCIDTFLKPGEYRELTQVEIALLKNGASVI